MEEAALVEAGKKPKKDKKKKKDDKLTDEEKRKHKINLLGVDRSDHFVGIWA